MTSWSLSLWLKYSMGKSAWLFYQVLVVKPPECVLRRPISCLHYIFNRNTLPKGDRYWGQTSGMPCKFMATPAFLRMSFSQCPIVADVTGKGESASNHSDNHSQPWFPVLMEMITDTPLLLTAIMDLLLDPQGKSPSNDGSGTSPVGRLECIRSTFQGRDLSEDAVTILCASWRTNTEASYSSAWNKWSRWCEQIHIGLLDAPLYEATRPERKRGLFGLKVLPWGYFLLGSPLSDEPLLMTLAAFVKAVSASTCETISFWKVGPNSCFPASGKSPLAYLERLGSMASSIRTRCLSQKRLFALPKKTSACRELDASDFLK